MMVGPVLNRGRRTVGHLKEHAGFPSGARLLRQPLALGLCFPIRFALGHAGRQPQLPLSFEDRRSEIARVAAVRGSGISGLISP